MKKYRILACLLALAMVLALLAGCGSTGNVADSPTPAQTPEGPSDPDNGGTSAPAEDVNAATAEILNDYLGFDAEAVRLQSYVDVAVLRGSWYDMGVQYAEQYPDEIKCIIVNNLGSNFRTFTSVEDMYAAVPHTEEVVNGIFPQYLDFCKGMSEGLGIAYEDILIGYSTLAPADSDDTACMAVAAWGEATGGEVYTAHHSDTSTVPLYYSPVLIMYPDDGCHNMIVSQGINPLAVMNDQGLSCIVTQGFSDDVDPTNVLPQMIGSLCAAATCSTAKEALQLNIDKCISGGGENRQFVDATGDAYVLECSPSHYEVRQSGDFGESDYILQSNSFLTEGMQPYHTVYPDCKPRYDSVEKLLQDTLASGGKITMDTIRSAMSTTSWYDKDADKWNYNWNLEGDETLFSPQNKDVYYGCAIRRVCNLSTLTMYVLKGTEQDLVSKVPYSTGAYAKIQMAESPADMMRAAAYEARYQVWLATQEIEAARAEGKDTTALMEHIDSARLALYQGGNYEALAAACSNENERVGNYSKALSLYYKAQTEAKQAKADPASLLG